VNAEPDTLEWCDVGSRGGRDWRPEQAKPLGEKERVVEIGGREG